MNWTCIYFGGNKLGGDLNSFFRLNFVGQTDYLRRELIMKMIKICRWDC